MAIGLWLVAIVLYDLGLLGVGAAGDGVALRERCGRHRIVDGGAGGGQR